MEQFGERMTQQESDQRLLAYWLARKADAQTALDTADRQIEYIHELLARHHIGNTAMGER